MKTLSTALAAAALAAAPLLAQKPAPDDETLRAATRAAQEALATYAKLVNAGNYAELGFDSAEQVRAATLGTPARASMVRLDELAKYAGGDAAALLHDFGRVTFPVEAGGATRSSLTVVARDGRWQQESFGAPAYARLFTEARAALAKSTGRPAAELFEVQVPALNLRLVGARRDGALLLAPVADDPRFGLERGQTLRAEELFQRLAPAAKEHNGLPT